MINDNTLKAAVGVQFDQFTVTKKTGKKKTLKIFTPNGSNWETKQLREQQTKDIFLNCEQMNKKLAVLQNINDELWKKFPL